jgi:hypothetical protein
MTGHEGFTKNALLVMVQKALDLGLTRGLAGAMIHNKILGYGPPSYLIGLEDGQIIEEVQEHPLAQGLVHIITEMVMGGKEHPQGLLYDQEHGPNLIYLCFIGGDDSDQNRSIMEAGLESLKQNLGIS